MYYIRLLGTIQIQHEDVTFRNFESRKALALLGYLIRQVEPVSRSHLASLFWGDKAEARGRRNLSHELSLLSSHLPGCFQADYHTVKFQSTADYWIDTLAFAELIKESMGVEEQVSSFQFRVSSEETEEILLKQLTDPETPNPKLETQPEKLAEAVALYRDDFMAEHYLDDCPEFETWLVGEQEAWRRRVTQVLERLVAHHTLSRQDGPAEFYIRRWLGLEPWREKAHRYLMRLLVRQGQRSAALAQYETCRRVLAAELGVEPATETTELYERIRAGELSRGTAPTGGFAQGQGSRGEISTALLPPRSFTPPPSAAPRFKIPTPSTPLIDREEEGTQIAERLADPACRLLTLVGPGGIGKTRLAIQVALQAAAKLSNGQVETRTGDKDFADGIYFIPLDPLSSAEFLVSTLADALNFSFYSGADPIRQLLNYLREKRMLLVLDNFEHLPAGADLVADILQHAPQVKILAVSRERLNLQGEWLLPVQGLSTPTSPPSSHAKQRDWEEVESYSAIQLFLQQAHVVSPGFSLSEEEKFCVVQICQLVEGIPLAIELAAAWLRLLSCQEIAQEIEHNLDFLATPLRNVPERHRSLRAVFDYSWQLLADEERRVFRQLVIFRGGFLREAAEQVVGASLPLLLALVDKSLLRRDQTGRYLRHVLLWQYAAEKLDESPQEKENIQNRHCDYYAAFLRQRVAQLEGGNQEETLAEIGAEIENIRTSWRWAVSQGKVTAIEQALDSLFHFYDMRSWFQEGVEVFGWAAVSLAGEEQRSRGAEEQRSGGAEERRSRGEYKNLQSSIFNPQSSIVLGKLLARQGWFTFQLGQHEPARALLQESLELLRRLDAGPGARPELVFTLNYLGAVHRHLGEYGPARPYLLESMAICQETGDSFGLSIALNILSQVAYLEGDYSQARQLGRESLAIKREIGDRRGMAYSLNNLGQVACTLAEYAEARRFFQESLAICQEIGDRRGAALSLNYLGDVARFSAAYPEAQSLYQDSLVIFKEIGNQLGQIFSQTKLGQVFSALGEDQTAMGYFTEALRLAMAIQAILAALDVLVNLAALLLKAGEAEQKQALEVLTLVLNHPTNSRDVQDRAAGLLAELEPQLRAERVITAQARGRTNTLEIVVKKLLRQAGD